MSIEGIYMYIWVAPFCN